MSDQERPASTGMPAATTPELSRKILCVDDDANILQALKRQLRAKFDVAIAQGGQQGLEVLRREGPFAVVVSDYNMPGMNGVAFLKQVNAEAPDTVLVMLTGLADLNVVVEALHNGRIFRFLNKPCSGEALADTLRICLDQYRLVISERILTAELNRANDELRLLNEGLERRVAERTHSLRRLHQFVSDLNGLETLDDVADTVVKATAEILHSSRVSLMLPDSSGEYLRMAAAVGIPDAVCDAIRVPIGSPIAGFVFSACQTIVANEAAELSAGGHRYDGQIFVSSPLVCASLVTPSQPVGVLNVTDHEGGRPYDDESLAQLKAIAESAAIALLGQIRLRERNEARDATILALAKLAEHRDPETGAHLERVQQFCRILCEALAQSPKYEGIIDHEFIDNIVRSSPLHDIGKVGVPDHILLKQGRLTPDEFEVMRRHATIGGDTIRSVVEQLRTRSFLQMGMQIAYAHHERYDGTGYPKGLRADDIPLPARILAVADVYDALTSRRCYKEAMSHEAAVEIIRGEIGTHFDPDVVSAFFSREDQFRRLRGELADSERAHASPEPEACPA